MMPPSEKAFSSRREFLTGRALRSRVEQAGSQLADALVEATERGSRPVPQAGDTVRLQTRAMACDFAVIMNPGSTGERLPAVSAALEMVHALEAQMTVYRRDSEVAYLNRRAAREAVRIERGLFQLLQRAQELHEATGRCFDPATGALIALWKRCAGEGRLPTEEEIAAALERSGLWHVELDAANQSVRYRQAGLGLDLGAIGKGYALDRVAEHLCSEGLSDWLIHGGHSSLRAMGDHAGRGGWPVDLRSPLFPTERLATILLRDRAMATSGTGVRFFRLGGRRFGHILDPRSGWPAEGMLSVTVLAPTAAEADALSTAFFVGGVEIARRYCDNHCEVAALLIPAPKRGQQLTPINLGIPEELLFFHI